MPTAQALCWKLLYFLCHLILTAPHWLSLVLQVRKIQLTIPQPHHSSHFAVFPSYLVHNALHPTPALVIWSFTICPSPSGISLIVYLLVVWEVLMEHFFSGAFYCEYRKRILMQKYRVHTQFSRLSSGHAPALLLNKGLKSGKLYTLPHANLICQYIYFFGTGIKLGPCWCSASALSVSFFFLRRGSQTAKDWIRLLYAQRLLLSYISNPALFVLYVGFGIFGRAWLPIVSAPSAFCISIICQVSEGIWPLGFNGSCNH